MVDVMFILQFIWIEFDFGCFDALLFVVICYVFIWGPRRLSCSPKVPVVARRVGMARHATVGNHPLLRLQLERLLLSSC